MQVAALVLRFLLRPRVLARTQTFAVPVAADAPDPGLVAQVGADEASVVPAGVDLLVERPAQPAADPRLSLVVDAPAAEVAVDDGAGVEEPERERVAGVRRQPPAGRCVQLSLAVVAEAVHLQVLQDVAGVLPAGLDDLGEFDFLIFVIVILDFFKIFFDKPINKFHCFLLKIFLITYLISKINLGDEIE